MGKDWPLGINEKLREAMRKLGDSPGMTWHANSETSRQLMWGKDEFADVKPQANYLTWQLGTIFNCRVVLDESLADGIIELVSADENSRITLELP